MAKANSIMNILVFTANDPSKKNLRIRYINSIQESLKKTIPTKIFWVICKPSKVSYFDSKDYSIYDIHQFKNGLELLSKIKPDVVIGSVGIEPIQYSLGLAAVFLKIPFISFLGAKIIFHPLESNSRYKIFLKKIFSNNTSIDSNNEEFFKRLRFFLYKLNFLVKTKISIKLNLFQIIFETMCDLPSQLALQPLKPNKISDLYIAHHENQKLNIVKKFVNEEKVIVTGHPLLDQIQKIFSEKQSKLNKPSQKKILIVTDSLFEHGLWSYEKRDKFLQTLLKTISENFYFDIKIHPSSEDIEYYNELINSLNLSANIFQEEELFQLLDQYDLVISYGYSTSHTEISYVGMKMILIYSGLSLPKFPLVEEGIDSGHIKECSKISELPSLILNFFKEEVIFNEKFIQSRNKMFYKSDGKSSERISNAIINLLSQKG